MFNDNQTLSLRERGNSIVEGINKTISFPTNEDSYVSSSNALTLSLNDMLQRMDGDPPESVPFLVWLLENPKSPIALPGKISLYRHDCLHILLQRGISLNDEAFVLGFTMGNDRRTNQFHLMLLKLMSWLFYPKNYRFSLAQLKIFDLGVAYGRSLNIKNLNNVDFTQFAEEPIHILQEAFGIDDKTLDMLEQVETMLTNA